MLLTDITNIIRVLLGAFGAVASQDNLTQRRVWQIGEVIGAVEDVAGDEEEMDETFADKRVEEAHDIIHRVAAILAMEDEGEDGGDMGGSDKDESGEDDLGNAVVKVNALQDDGTGQGDAEQLAEVPWDGTLDGETIELKEDEE